MSEERTTWDINPLKTRVELSEGNIKISESAVYNGRVRVSKALQTSTSEDATWLYVQAESRDGADVNLTLEQTKELRDALTKVIESVEED